MKKNSKLPKPRDLVWILCRCGEEVFQDDWSKHIEEHKKAGTWMGTVKK